MYYKQRYTKRNAHVGYIEDFDAERTNAEVHEIDHTAGVPDTVGKIAQPPFSTGLAATTVVNDIG